MPIDNALETRTAIINHFAAYSPLTALVPASSIYGVRTPAEPAWPFIRFGAPLTTPYEAVCWDGAEHSITVHVFAEGEDDFPVGEIVKQVVEAMKTLTDVNVLFVNSEWVTTNIIPDNAEATNWHGIVTFNVVSILVA